MDRGERRHNRRVSGYERRALRLMRWAAAEAARLVQLYGGGKAGEPFRIDRSMPLRRAVDALLKDLHASLLEEVRQGVYREWTVAESEADALAARAEGMYPVREAERAAWRTHRDAAREAFAARRERGLSLSDRVWRVVDGFAAEVEAAASEAIGNGTPAERLATSIKQHLNEPNRLYRRVRGPNGKLRLSKAAAAYHPGRGVYRSSFMNARRLAVTETNMAYRAADFERWQQMDFVVGIEIRLSNNHNCKGVPPGTFRDICDELAGRYPKEFKFTGWHPHCRCHAVPILKRPEEMGRQGAESANAVNALPKEFEAYVAGNRGRIATAAARGALPYFLRDNFTVAADGTLAARWGGGESIETTRLQYFTLYRNYPKEGGMLYVDRSFTEGDRRKSDFYTVRAIGGEMARLGRCVEMPNSYHYKDPRYDIVFGMLKGTEYYRKCPDLIIDGQPYEYEGFVKPWRKSKVGRMVNNGLRQSKNIIINNSGGCSDRFILRIVANHNKRSCVGEVWVYERGKIRRLK